MKKIKFYSFSEKTEGFAEPPAPASKFVPEWYRRQPGSIDDAAAIPKGGMTSTIKRCMPIFDLMTAGYMITAPCDIYIDATNPEKLSWSVPQALKSFGSDLVATHGIEQYNHYPLDKTKYHKDLFRIMPFWVVQTPPGYSSLIMNPMHQDHQPFWAFGGIIDTDKFLSDGHFSFMIEKDFKGIIKQGTPLAQVIPIKREDWESESVNAKEAAPLFLKQRLNVRSVFINAYKNKFRQEKKYK